MFELTPSQTRELSASDAAPVRVTNPETNEAFVLVPAAEYMRLKHGEEYDDGEWTQEDRDALNWHMISMIDDDLAEDYEVPVKP